MTDCELLSQIRSRAFNSYLIDKDQPIWTVKQLLAFLKGPEMDELELEDPYKPLTQLTPPTHPRAAGDPTMGQSQDPSLFEKLNILDEFIHYRSSSILNWKSST